MFKPFCLSLLLLTTAAISSAHAQSFETEATKAVILDHDTGIVLFEKDARTPTPPASMTKIMTAQLVFEALRDGEVSEDTTFKVSEESWRRGGVQSGSSTMFLKLGSDVPVIDLLRGVIVQSGNDACITLAEGLSGSEDAFARRMTDRAAEMGLDSANFVNATGWPDPGHEISTLDLAKLTRAQISEFPKRYEMYAERSYTWNEIKQDNRNPLLGRYTGADGVKTGRTDVSGYGLVGSAVRDGARRIIVINGLDSSSARRSEAIRIMDAAFRDFEVVNAFTPGDEMGESPVYMGKANTVGLVLRDKISLGTHRADRKSIAARIEYREVPAPVQEGAQIAELVVTKSGSVAGRYPLYAATSVERRGFFARAGAAFMQKIRG